MSNTLEVNKWKVTRIYESLTNRLTDDGDKIRIPVFQRGLCWSRISEERLIDSLYNSFPIGSLLFYKKRGIKEYVLIDGLQRANTIKKFFSDRSVYFKKEFLSKSTLDLITRIEEEEKIYGFFDYTLSLIKRYIQENKSDSSFFNNAYIEKYNDILNNKLFKSINDLSAVIVEDLLLFSNINNYEVPIIIFECDNNDVISEIFKRINDEGKKLSIYDIYAASWDKKKFPIKSDEIIDFIVKRYENYIENNLDVDDYNKSDMLKYKNINSFEFVFGVGKLLARKYQNLFGRYEEDSGLVHSLGFELLNLCYGNGTKDMDLLDKIIIEHKDNVEIILEALDFSCEQIVKIIKPYIYFKGNQHKNDYHILHSYWQILSMVAYLFRNIYNTYSDYILLDKVKIVNSLKNRLVRYYIFDIICKNWREGNVAFAYKTIRDNRYSDDIDKESFISALDNYFSMQLNYRETQNVSGVSSADYIILNTIYKKIFTAEIQLDDDYRFDVEHLCPKKQMIQIIKKISGTNKPDSLYGLPISSIANLCYLPSEINRSKKDKTIYQDKGISKELQELIESKYSFTTENSLLFLDEDYGENFVKFKEKYISFLTNRYFVLKKMFIQSLGYDYSTSQDQRNNIKEDYSKFDGMKVGQVAKIVFKELLYDDFLDAEELENLLNQEYCRGNFKLTQYPVFSNVQMVHAGKNRYYVEPLLYKGERYFLTSEWYDESRDLVIDYYFHIKKRVG